MECLNEKGNIPLSHRGEDAHRAGEGLFVFPSEEGEVNISLRMSL